jgi:hypothetical protein
VLLTFAGRRDRMALLQHYVEQAIQRGIVDEWHVWNFARNAEDAAWLAATFPAVRRTANDAIYRPVTAKVPVAASYVLRVDIRAATNAHIALTPDGAGPSYELILGGWGNSAVALRVWPAGTRPDHTKPVPPVTLASPAPALFSGRAWRSVEVRMTRDAGVLSLTLLVAGRELLRFDTVDDAPLPFDVAVMSGYGASAEWRFADDRPANASLFYTAEDPLSKNWNEVYHYYSGRADEYAETVFIKCDDDIVYLDFDRLADFIHFRRAQPDYFLTSANVVNNGVCAHVQQQLGMIPRDLMNLEMPPGGLRGTLWKSGAKAEALHRCFLANPRRFLWAPQEIFIPPARFSINFVAWLGVDVPHFETRLADDEHDLTVTLPRFLGRENAIYLPFVVSHLSFRTQDTEMDVPGILDAYRALAAPLAKVHAA